MSVLCALWSSRFGNGRMEQASVSVVAALAAEAREEEVHGNIVAIVATAAGGLARKRIAVALTQALERGAEASTGAGVEHLASTGPFQVAQSSRLPLQITAALVLGLIVALATRAFFAERVNRRLRARLAQGDTAVGSTERDTLTETGGMRS